MTSLMASLMTSVITSLMSSLMTSVITYDVTGGVSDAVTYGGAFDVTVQVSTSIFYATHILPSCSSLALVRFPGLSQENEPL